MKSQNSFPKILRFFSVRFECVKLQYFPVQGEIDHVQNKLNLNRTYKSIFLKFLSKKKKNSLLFSEKKNGRSILPGGDPEPSATRVEAFASGKTAGRCSRVVAHVCAEATNLAAVGHKNGGGTAPIVCVGGARVP